MARAYKMGVRAQKAAETGRRILDAAWSLYFEHGHAYDEVTLREIAAAAGVTEQTVLRRFGSKEGVIDAIVEVRTPEIERQRDTPVGDVDGAVRAIVADYEVSGDGTIRMLAEEGRVPPIARAADIGRASHRAWCEHTFAPFLPDGKSPDYRRRVTLFVSATDVYTWKLLRRDAGLSRKQTETAMRELAQALADQHEREEATP